ncbi:MAG: hypothetical protein VX028_00740, partial [Nanoarchaeota archaeon]|nr:hypothetical protein [Nanoarchaeota archaeon]
IIDMRLLSKAYEALREKSKNKHPKVALLSFLEELQGHEAKLWGVTLNRIKSDEEVALEDSHHLIYLIQNTSSNSLKKALKMKETKDLLEDLKDIREDFLYLKKQITYKNNLKSLISEFTLRCSNQSYMGEFTKILLLEKQLYEVLEKQDDELRQLFSEIEALRIKKHDDDTLEYFIDALKRIRTALAGHLDHHEFWEEERRGFSNISNILHEIHKKVEKISMNG